MITIYEPPVRNSGIIGGKFLERTRVAKPCSAPTAPSFYGPQVSFQVKVNDCRVLLLISLYWYQMMATAEKWKTGVLNWADWMFLLNFTHPMPRCYIFPLTCPIFNCLNNIGALPNINNHNIVVGNKTITTCIHIFKPSFRLAVLGLLHRSSDRNLQTQIPDCECWPLCTQLYVWTQRSIPRWDSEIK